MALPLLAAIPAILGGLQQNQQAMQPDPISPVKSGAGVNTDAIGRRLNQQQDSALGILQLGMNALGKQPPEIQQKVGPQIEGAIQKLNPQYDPMKRGMMNG